MPNPIAAPGGAYQGNPIPGQGGDLTIQPPAGKYTTFPQLLEGKLPQHLPVDQEQVGIVQDQGEGEVAWTPERLDQAQGMLPSLPGGPEGFFLTPGRGEPLEDA